jgi:hypothetical protein
MLKKYTNFILESKDYYEDLTRTGSFFISESKCYSFFKIGDLYIGGSENIKNIINKYKETYHKNSEWIGGPVNSEFIDYINKKYNSKIESYINKNIWKPSLELFLENELGIFSIGFSVIGDTKPSNLLLGYYKSTLKDEINQEKLDFNVLKNYRIEYKDIRDEDIKGVIYYLQQIYRENITLYDFLDTNNINLDIRQFYK